MTPTESYILAWLRARAARHDRTLAYALASGNVLSIEELPEAGRWRVHVRSKRGVDHRVVVRTHPVTGDPTHYHREPSV
jgi:hypothetical protein